MHNPWLVNATGERTALVSSESVDSELLAELLGALDGLKRATRAPAGGFRYRLEQERLHALSDELEGRLGYAAFYAVWQQGKGHSIEETICVIGRVLDCLSTAALGTVSHLPATRKEARPPRETSRPPLFH